MEDEEMQTGGLGILADPHTETLRSAFAAQTDILKQQQALAKQRYEEGRQRIEQMRLGPTRSEQLMAISQALLSPSPYRNRFKGTLANLSQVAGPMVGANRRAELEKAEMLRQLTEQYEDRALDVRQTAADLAAARAKAPRTGFNPISGELVSMETGAPVESLQAPREAFAELSAYVNHPQVSAADRSAAIVDFATQFRVNPQIVAQALFKGEQ
jgi:hypothetical protein